MKSRVRTGARIILGLIYFVFGGMGLAIAVGLMTMPEPEGMPDAAMAFMGGMMAAPYFFPVLKLTETIFGGLLLFDVAAPLALVVLTPVTLQIILFHGFMTPVLGQQILPIFMGMAHAIAMTKYADLYRPMLGKGIESGGG